MYSIINPSHISDDTWDIRNLLYEKEINNILSEEFKGLLFWSMPAVRITLITLL